MLLTYMQVAAAAFHGRSTPAQPQPDFQTAAVVRARVVAAKCVEHVVTAAKAELAQLAAKAQKGADAARRKAEEAQTGRLKAAEPEAQAEQQRGAVLSDDGAVSLEDADIPDVPFPSGESSQVGPDLDRLK